jgi:hypothetical protein
MEEIVYLLRNEWRMHETIAKWKQPYLIREQNILFQNIVRILFKRF